MPSNYNEIRTFVLAVVMVETEFSCWAVTQHPYRKVNEMWTAFLCVLLEHNNPTHDIIVCLIRTQ